MKIQLNHFKAHPHGFATLVFMVLLGIMMILVAANVQMLVHLHATEKLIEQKQIQRLNVSQTNAITIVKQSESK